VRRVIWKYEVAAKWPTWDECFMPPGSRIVHVAIQGITPHLWAEVIRCADDSPEMVPRKFTVIGTGQPMPIGSTYVGTVHQPPFVWHVVEYTGG